MHHMYHQLSQHLARHPAGYPSTVSGLEIEILKKLFTREEAEIAVHLTPRPQTVKQLSEKTGINKDELAKVLARMADKGLIFERKKGDELRYALVAFVPGIYEFQVQKLDEELAHAFEDLYPDLVKEIAGAKTPWMRVLPAEQSLSQMEIIPYQSASQVVSQAQTIAITDCICRKEQKLVGRGCARPLDSICMYFDAWGEFAIDKGIGKKATVQEALKVLQRGENAGLVHLGLNVTENMVGMCQCCACCCGVMRSLTQFKMPTAVAKSSYYAVVNIELCNGCESCVSICPVSAISMDRKDEKAVVSSTGCIGCGLCAVECAPGALSLVARKQDETVPPPRDVLEMWRAIAEEKGKTYFYSR